MTEKTKATEVLREAMIRHQRIPKGVGSGNTCGGCNHLDGETDGANSPRHVEHQIEVGLAALAAAGYVVTAEPATAPSVEQIARAVYLHGLSVPHAPSVLPPVCVAPDCDWSSDLKGVDLRDAHNIHVGEVIRALYGTPADDTLTTTWAEAKRLAERAEKAEAEVARMLAADVAGEPRREGIMVPGSAYVEMTKARDKAEARVKELGAGPRLDMYEPEDGIAEIDGDLWVPSKDYDEKLAEVERCKAALEAADSVIASIKNEARLRDAWHEAKWSIAVAKDDMNAARDYAIQCTDAYDAARAAVEAGPEGATNV